jgi:hypothetical protein
MVIPLTGHPNPAKEGHLKTDLAINAPQVETTISAHGLEHSDGTHFLIMVDPYWRRPRLDGGTPL